jgi:quinoprotein glucose dehydrogenase
VHRVNFLAAGRPTKFSPRVDGPSTIRRRALAESLIAVAYLAFCLVPAGFCTMGLGIATASADDETVDGSEANRPEPLEPQIAEASSEGIDAISSFRIPEGWQIELFAAEPDVANVVAMDVDNLGRVFACESFRQNRGVTDNRGHDEAWLMRDLAAQTVQDRIDYHRQLLGDEAKTYVEQDDRIRLLVDSDGDGKADQSTVFASGFNALEDGTAAGVLARGNQVYLTNIPKLYQLIDADGDGVADERVVLADGFGVRVAFRGHDMHGLVIGPDGRLYFSIGDRGYHVVNQEGQLLHDATSGAVFRCELDGSNLEVFATGLRNPQELAFNDYGDLFTGDNNSDSGDKARLVHVLRGGDTGWRMYYQYLPDRGPFNREKIWEPFHDSQPAYIVPPITNFADGPSGLTYYPGTGFGDQLKDHFLMADFRGGASNSGIRAFRLQPQGAFYELAEDSELIWSVLATDVTFGPDGGLYISDWVNGWDGEGKGRIYCLKDPQFSETDLVGEVSELLASDWSYMYASSLATLLTHADRRVRYEAQWELAKRGAIDLLALTAMNGDLDTIARLHGVWGLGQILRQSPDTETRIAATVRGLLGDSDDYLRAAAAELAGQLEQTDTSQTLMELVDDPSPRVRYFASMAIGDVGNASGFESVLQMLAQNDNRDPAIRHSGIMALTKIASADRLATLAAASSANVRRAAVVALRNQAAIEVTSFLNDGDPRVLAEAARAIHDRPISAAMPMLADLIARPLQDEELIRRVLNANYRLGSQQHADALASYAGTSAAPDAMRLEALAMLGKWADPDPRDRVLNDWRPLGQRDVAQAATSLKTHLGSILSGSEQVRGAAISLAAELGLEEITPLLIERLDDAALAADLRATALTALAKLDSESAATRSRQILAREDTAPPIRVAAVKTLANLDAAASVDLFIASTAPERSTGERQAAWDALAKIDSPVAAEAVKRGIESLLAGDLSTDTALNLIEAATAMKQTDAVDRVQQAIADMAEANPLAPWLPAMRGGNAEQGATLFFTKTELSCVRCHKVGSQGGEVGPDLSGIAKEKDAAYLLEAIVAPDAKIAKGYETSVIADDLGTVHTGIVKAETEDYVDLIKADGSQVRILTDEIVGRRRGQSAMPADLTKYMTRRELRDLVAYLQTLNQAAQVGEGGHE